MKEIERVSKEPPPLNIKVLSASLNVIQDDSRKGIDVQNLNTIMSFITRNKLEMKFQINDDPTEHPFAQENIPLGFTPHPDEQGKWQSIQQGATAQNTVQNVLLDGNREDITTIMEQTECNMPTAVNALSKCGGDIIAAIMNIDQYKVDENSAFVSNSNVESEDVQTVIEQSGCNEEIAKKALSLCDNDVIAAIMKIASGELSASDEPDSSENVTMEVSA
jgi:NACalpha-BTF3-like transcription factor